MFFVSSEKVAFSCSFDKMRKARKYFRKLEKSGDSPVLFKMDGLKVVKYSHNFIKNYR